MVPIVVRIVGRDAFSLPPPVPPIGEANSFMNPRAFCFAILGLAVSVPAWAQGPREALVTAVAYRPLPEARSVEVCTLDDSEHNLALQKEFERVLLTNGYQVAVDGNLILTFETRDEIGAWVDEGRRTVLELRGQTGPDDTEHASVRFNIFDSRRGGIINEGEGGTAIMTPSRYRLEVNVDDRSNGRRVWQGWSVADLGHGDTLELGRAMVRLIVENLGKTISRETFATE